MDKVTVTLLGNPFVTYQGKNVLFPYKKAEGLFYFLCTKKRISREEAIDLFWNDCDLAAARKNLRNAIYNLRKIFGQDIIMVEGTSVVELNPDRDVVIDLDFVSEDAYAENEFLHFFYIKDCYEFEKWIDEIRSELKDLYIQGVKKQIIQCRSKKDAGILEKNGLRLLREQIWDEELHRLLIRKMAELGKYQAAINQYQHLARDLEENLGVTPERETEEVYLRVCEIKAKVHVPVEEVEEYFYGRENVFYHIFSRIKENRDMYGISQARSFVITGEAGVGKTMLLKRFQKMLREEGHFVFSWNCWEADIYLRPWYGIIAKIDQYCKENGIHIQAISNPVFRQEENADDMPIYLTKLQSALEMVFLEFESLFPDKKLILFIDELQWMDAKSIHLLGNIIFRMQKSNLSVICAYRGDRWTQYLEKLSNFQIPLIGRGILETIELQQFTKEEVREIARECLVQEIAQEELDWLYDNTGGNAHFLMEMMKYYQVNRCWEDNIPEINNIIHSRLLQLGEMEKNALEMLSVFSNGVSLEEVLRVFPDADMKIAKCIDTLLERNIIKEEIEGEKMYIRFSCQLVKKYMYRNLSASKRYLIMKKLGLS